MQKFIETANFLGKQKRPFYFLIDFETRKPIIVEPENAEASGLFLHFFGNNTPLNKAFQFSASPIGAEEYQRGFDLVQREIQAGNSYLLNLTYPTKIKCNYSLAEIYAAAQAKYKCYLKDQFVCFSPECFVKIQQNKIYSYPMKGTINAAEPNAAEKLLHSDKELSEHNTIVDLIRNDLAIVAKNIQVSKYRYLEKVQTHRGAIWQTSSEICGELDENWQENIGTILAKLLPAGSISGAPKVKTVEIIQAAEGLERGYYTGIFGCFDGESLDSAVAIRYIEQKDGQLYFRSGGGITHQSQFNEEYLEIQEKVYVPINVI